ncbi:unnamed protein product [Mytilus edulis]|uniref:Uncharacterized protein n=1 Tax=Mytilus edulis TaxID=6550 RepID=A0A8S3UBH0_MYTED|nr:unnamed protein product [Mytilus edulis]
MVFVILRVKCGVNEKKAWYATNFSDEKTIFDLYNEFASRNLDNKSPVNEIQNSRITAHIGTKKSELNTEIDPSTKLCDAVPCLGPYIEYRVNKDVNENCVKNAKADAFTILMQVSQQYRTECSASKKVFQGDKERWEYLAPVSNINPTKQARYNLLHTAIIHSDFFAPIVVNDYNPGEPNRRYDYFKGLIVPVKCCQFTYTGSKEHLMFLWKVPMVSESDLLTKNMQIACNLRKSLPVYHSRAMRREFLSLFGRTISNKSAFLREAYRRLTGDQSASLTASQTEVDRRISEILDNEDSELICDLRLNNRGQPEKYNEFLSECQNYINEKLELAVDDRRHDKIDKGGDVITHLADAFSVRDLYEQVKAKLAPNILVPSQQWLRWQFWPRHANFQSSHRYTGKLKVKFMIQSRQFRKTHVDMHYASAIFRYQKEFAIMYKPFCNFVCMDDKHKLKVGEPGYPVATVERGKQVIVAMGKKFEVADHDFTKFSITPSVNLFSEIPDEIEQTFYGGQVFVGVKETAFQSSSPWRHATEMSKILKNSFLENGMIKPILIFYSDGGPDHRLTYVSVQMSLICLFLIFDLDMICVARTPPQNSWKNPAERIMSILNLGFQSLGLMREKTEHYEKQLDSANSLGEIRKLAEKYPTIEEEVLDSVEPVSILLSNVITRLKWKDKNLKVFNPATEGEIFDLRREILKIDQDIKVTDSTQQDIKKRKLFVSFLNDHCKIAQYIFSVKKCGKTSCHVCKKPRLSNEMFESLYHLPDPEPLNCDKYKSFDQLYGKPTSEKYRPSLVGKPSSEHGLPFSPSSRYAKNVEMVVLCSDCDKPRVLYSKKVVRGVRRTQLSNCLTDIQYTCGFSFDELDLEEETHVLKTVFVRKNPTCNCTVELSYYSAGFLKMFVSLVELMSLNLLRQVMKMKPANIILYALVVKRMVKNF